MLDAGLVHRIGFLHTASVHVETFNVLLGEIAPSLEPEHLVRPALLERARLVGATDHQVRIGVCSAITEFCSPAVVLCTCSTIGSVAEACGIDRGIRVLRVDRPMAELAVRSGHKIAVVAVLESTLTPTRSLLESAAREAGETVEIVDAPCLNAWTLLEAGDEDGFHRSIADHLETLDPSFEVAVLAQASMAPAARMVSRIRVLTSPRLGVEAAYRLAATGAHRPEAVRLRRAST